MDAKKIWEVENVIFLISPLEVNLPFCVPNVFPDKLE